MILGCGLALLGWLVVERFRAVSLQELILPAGQSGDRWTVALLFTPEECPSRMKLVDQLNQLKVASVRVQGLLITDTMDFTNWRDLIIANRISFPVRPVSQQQAHTARAALAGLPTPLLLVFDAEGRLRIATDISAEAAIEELPSQIALARRNRTPPAPNTP